MRHSRYVRLFCSVFGAALLQLTAASATRADQSVLLNLPAAPQISANTIPSNGDVNPYGVAFVPRQSHRDGMLHGGDILVSNFNDSANLQGTGTTIVRITPAGATSVFFQGATGLGLTTALGVLSRGYVLVGNVPADSNGNALQGSLLILDRNGNLIQTLADPNLLNGPWDLTLIDRGDRAWVFVSNVLSGTVTRLGLKVDAHRGVSVESAVQIASGYMHRSDPAAFEIGPTGLAFDEQTGALYVASTGDNAVYRVWNAAGRHTDAGTGEIAYQDNAHLRGPLGLVLTPNGHLITTNGDAINPDATQPSEMVEFTRGGTFIAQVPVNSTGQGGAFGIAAIGTDDRVILTAVDDIANMLYVWDVRTPDHDRH